MKKIISLAFSACLLSAAPIVLDFEGLQNQEEVNLYYNGGTGSLGSGPGVNHGISFNNGLALIDEDAGGSGNFANEPSPDTIIFWVSGADFTMNVAAGFDTGFSLYYAAFDNSASVEVYDGLDGTGTLLASTPLPQVAFTDPGDPTGDASTWTPTGITFSGTARSVKFIGTAGAIGFDDITFGSATAGGGSQTVAVPLFGPFGYLLLASLMGFFGYRRLKA